MGKNLASQEMLSAIFRISSRGIFPMIVSSAQFETVQKPCKNRAETVHLLQNKQI